MGRPAIDPARYDPIIGKARMFVLNHLCVGRVDLISHRRDASLVRARALFVWIVKTHGPEWLSHPVIGWWLGGRDHSSIMHLWREVAPRLLERDPEFRALCERFSQEYVPCN